jgi:TonB family protein
MLSKEVSLRLLQTFFTKGHAMNQGNKAFVYSKDEVSTDRLVVNAFLHGQPWGQWMLKEDHEFCVGWGRKSLAPVAPEYVSSSDFALLQLKDGACRVSLAQTMLAAIAKDGIFHDLSEPSDFELKRGSTARVTCGAMAFNVAWMPPPAVIGKPKRKAWSAQWPLMVSVFALLGMLGVLWLVPADPMALSVWDPQRTIHLLPAQSIPAVVPIEETLAVLKSQGAGGGSRTTAKPARSQAKPRAHRDQAQTAASAPSIQEPAPDKIGVLDVLNKLGNFRGSVANVFSNTQSDSLGEAVNGLSGVSMGDAYAVGGMGVSLDGGPAGATVGEGGLGTIGFTCKDGKECRHNGNRYGHGVDGLGPKKRTMLPNVSIAPCAPGAAGCGAHGVLDRELVRREIRKHIKEIEYCYEQQLVRAPTLSGRVAVRFVIAPTGTVAAAVIAESSLGNVRVESCVTGAVRRWQFPVAQQAGTTIVTYPFVFSPVGG